MANALKKSPVLWLVVGLVLGLVVAGLWPQSQAHALATDRYENFAISTGPVDDGLEALYVLDSVTGELQAFIINQQSGKFNQKYTRAVAADLGIPPGQKPRYLMVTGIARIVGRGGGAGRGTESLLYVAELTTGKVAAYAVPFAGQNPRGPVQGQFLLADVAVFRQAGIRRGGVGGN